jgi:5'-deoxynucleotidase YfbR-like HD superfamily hydrolase
MKTFKKMYPSGRYINFAAPQEAYVAIDDIAWSLSMQCRFGGCCMCFYSVAQHSVLVSQLVPEPYRMQGLLHDAHEAYVQDLVTAEKWVLGAAWGQLEAEWEQIVRKEFCLPPALDRSVKEADLVMLATERRDLLQPDTSDEFWPEGYTPLEGKILPVSPREAFAMFMRRYYDLRQGGQQC